MRTLLTLFGLIACGTASEASPRSDTPPVTTRSVIECRSDKLPHFRFELEAPPVAGHHARSYDRRIKFWNDTQLIGDDVIRVVVSRHLTRVEVGDQIAADGQHGFRFELLDVDYTSSPKITPIGFTGEVTMMGARAALTCRRMPSR